MAQRKRVRERRRARPQGPSSAPRPAPVERARRAAHEARTRWRDRLGAILAWTGAHRVAVTVGGSVVASSFVLYLATAARDIVFGDTPELTAVALTLGVAHPPGYPVFTMLGWLFGQLPVGPLPFRIALLSVICHAATVGAVYAATLRFTRSIPAAAVAAAALAFEPLFWYWSLVGEVFPLNDLLAATMLLLVALWHEHPERKRLLVAGALVGGIGMANHQTIALLAPAVLYVMWRRRDVLLRDPGLLRDAAVAFAVGLIPYFELLVAAGRHPAVSWGDLRTPLDLVGHFLRQSYGTGSLIADPKFAGGSAIERVLALFTSFDPLQWLLLSAGCLYAWRAKRWYVTYILIGFAAAGPAFAAYSNANLAQETTRPVLERFFLLPQVVIAPLAGFAILWARDLAARIKLPRGVTAGAAAVAALMAAAALIPLNYRQVDESENRVARTFANDLLATMKPNTIFLGAGDPVVFSLLYLQAIEGARRDVTLVGLPLLSADWYVRELRRFHPDVVLRSGTYGPGGAPIRSLIDANQGRPLASLGDLPDDSTRGVYWYYSRGLIFDVKPLSEQILLDDMAVESEKTLASYHVPRHKDLMGPFRVWERLVLVDYALGYYRVGREFEIGADSVKAKDAKQAADLYERATSWYRRALEVDPKLPEAVQALQRVSRP